MGLTAGWQRSIALLFGEASKAGSMSLQTLSAMSLDEREVGFAIVATWRNVRGTVVGQTHRG
jgi:hypothetical protein